MGIFDKLFGGDKKAEKAASDFLKKFAEAIGSEPKKQQPAQNSEPERREPVKAEEDAGIPAEENQYNYKGTYIEYFDHVFKEEFPSYRIEHELWYQGKRAIFTFWDGGRKALVVEVLNSNADAKKLRAECAASGVPYLRYYHDHDGWWNTRAYVTERTRKALQG